MIFFFNALSGMSFPSVPPEDSIKAELRCPEKQQYEADANCRAYLPDLTAIVDIQGINPPWTVSQTPQSGTMVEDETVVDITVTDDYGNSYGCSITINLTDFTEPEVKCPGNQFLIAGSSCEAELDNYTDLVEINDNCQGMFEITQEPEAGTVISSMTGVSITVTDHTGNISGCSFDIMPEDQTPPVIECSPDQVVKADAMDQWEVPDYTVTVKATDNCDQDIPVQQTPSPGTVAEPGQISITLTATDSSGNTTECSFEVEVVKE
ncbi:MAG: HYR domain-containing protein [Bacteroidetes bacterium]|nr:HYR domain-containing protein [Bacteroidota bacterium]